MIDLAVLDRLIAFVTVLLLLSLLVQSIQALAKQMFKLKSSHIEKSLAQLFETALATNTPAATETPAAAEQATDIPAAAEKTNGVTNLVREVMKKLLKLGRRSFGGNRAVDSAAAEKTKGARDLVDKVMKELLKLGRRSFWGNSAVDSIAKEDLLKILTLVELRDTGGPLGSRVQSVTAAVTTIQNAVKNALDTLPPATLQRELEQLRRTTSPIVEDVATLVSGNTVEPAKLVRDMARLREVSIDPLVAPVTVLRQAVLQQIETEKTAGGDTNALEAVDKQLAAIDQGIATLREGIDGIVRSLRAKLDSVENWFDTVMQGFDERYQRSMRLWTFVISFGVVVFLDAFPVDVYRASADPAVLKSQLALAQTLHKELTEPAPTPTPLNSGSTPAATPTPTLVSTPALEAAASPNPEMALESTSAANSTRPPKPPPTPKPVTQEELELAIKRHKREIADNLDRASTLGLGFKLSHVQERAKALDQGIPGLGLLLTAFGWLAMSLMVWLGAPFWHDVLEALFGVKRLVRKKADDRNVEQQSGAGNPKP